MDKYSQEKTKLILEKYIDEYGAQNVLDELMMNESFKDNMLSLISAGMITWGAMKYLMNSENISKDEKRDYIEAYNKAGYDKAIEIPGNTSLYTVEELTDLMKNKGISAVKQEVSRVHPYIINFDEKEQWLHDHIRKYIDNYSIEDKNGNKIYPYRGREIRFSIEFLMDLCAYLGLEPAFVFAVIEIESVWGVTNIAIRTNSICNVGVEDNGIKSWAYTNSQDEALVIYANLLITKYLMIIDKDGTISYRLLNELLQDGHFVRVDTGARYASEKKYEAWLRNRRRSFQAVGFNDIDFVRDNPDTVFIAIYNPKELKKCYIPGRNEFFDDSSEKKDANYLGGDEG